VKSQLSSKSLCSCVLTVVCIFIECVECMYSLYIILLRIGGSVIEGSTRLRAATNCSQDRQ
jgi:N-acetylmuramic acid 6-phosphate (MurNAc-6-P) etherase